MTKAQIRHMVDRFLGWRLPENFSPDGGISFKPFGNEGTPHQYKHDPTGTNLLDATQAEAMVRYMLEGLPVDAERRRLEGIASAALALSTAMVDSEANGGDYELVDDEWMRLTAAFHVVQE